MTFTKTLEKLLDRHDLTSEEASFAMNEVMNDKQTEAEIAAFLIALRMKGESIGEVSGFAEVMREKATSIHPNVDDIVDTCGTGGDHSHTFNISTAAAFVVAGAGVPVAKHGNRAASSSCGSADVLETLGVNIELSPGKVEKCIEQIGIGFLFAPLFHTSIKHVTPVRRQLKVRTVFNILGPLTNPAGADKQVIGVFDPDLTEFLAHVLKRLGSEHAMVVHGNGLDEITITAPSKISELKDGEITTYQLDPAKFGFANATLEDLKGGAAPKNAAILEDILKGAISPKRDIVILNAAAAIIVAGKALDFDEGIRIATESIDSGKAMKKLEELVAFSKKN